ncbi:MAG: hypothetical protein U1B80_07750, partial [Anaerolineaceae bacterium]|nr:hypothetical protein [Anaerolineaceae bacterium]
MTADKKTRSPAKRVVAGVVLLTWILATLACARSVGTPPSMAATAWAMQLTAAAPQGDETPSTSPKLESTESLNLFTPTPHLTPEIQVTIIPSPTPNGSEVRPARLYYAQAGDTVPALAARFAVEPEEITSPETLIKDALITPNQ